jgi:hypothetical protein
MMLGAKRAVFAHNAKALLIFDQRMDQDPSVQLSWFSPVSLPHELVDRQIS